VLQAYWSPIQAVLRKISPDIRCLFHHYKPNLRETPTVTSEIVVDFVARVLVYNASFISGAFPNFYMEQK